MRAILRRPVGNLKEGTWVNISKFYKRLDNTMAVIAGDFNSGVHPLRCSLSDVTLFPERDIKEAAVIPTNVARGVCDAVDFTWHRQHWHIKEGGGIESFERLVKEEILRSYEREKYGKWDCTSVDLVLKNLGGIRRQSAFRSPLTYDYVHAFTRGPFSNINVFSNFTPEGIVHLKAYAPDFEIGECIVEINENFAKVAKEALKQWAEKANRI